MENLINGDLLKPISDLGIALLDKVGKALNSEYTMIIENK